MKYHNVLVRMPNWVGDIVMATPVITDLKMKWPGVKITAMCPAPLSDLLVGNLWLDEIFTFSRPNEFLRRKERDVIERVKQGKYDLGVLLTNSFSSAVMFWKGDIEERIGFAGNFRNFFLTQSIPPSPEKGREHLVSTYKKLLVPLGIPLSNTVPKVFVTAEEKVAAQKLLEEYGVPPDHRILGINPIAAYGDAKCWPIERYRELAVEMAKREKTSVVFFGDTNGAEQIRKICTGMPPHVINLAGLTTLRELMALIEICDLFITNDSGPMHIAAALKTPLIAIFGSTNEIATGPYQQGRVVHKHVSCSPCYRKKCPIDFRCMTSIKVEEIIREIDHFWT